MYTEIQTSNCNQNTTKLIKIVQTLPNITEIKTENQKDFMYDIKAQNKNVKTKILFECKL